ncbi:heavy metal translocating P-type ATPase [Paeniglutamicibacter gangotriensis]|uniref:Copper(I)-transporting ATPase n=2 Tax=Paeniglutamicibacter gangotriensis TaxID=254787 RepID=M7MWP7_9MICC|nr:heavy metal translocating P-type ATPase [Paeniglutamicibacter gangotriensis]EMQ99496.1 copper(I)-transporting ATPase [Paeniglutamicibacter gangotriensis Lz1y]KAA0979066.1 cadmium-translocating P-type ATPase [Paeniglutamicibacter gangotriensis]
MKRYPLVVATLVVLSGTLLLLPFGMGEAARWIAGIFALGVALQLGWGMVKDIARGHWGIDILAFTAILATVFVGEWVAALIICLMVSGGEALEDYAQVRATQSLSELMDRVPTRTRLMDAAGNLTEVLVEAVTAGDVLLVRPGEVLPVDGVLLEGEADFDESSLTGESMPVHKLAGEQLLSGSVNGTRAISMRAAASAADSQYSRIVELVQEASSSRAPMVRLADRYAVPFTLLAYVIAGAAWWVSGDPVRFAEVLVVATPCPLLIAAPVAFMGGMSRAAKGGIIVKDGGTLEKLAAVQSVAFDKTGTLTRGTPELRGVKPVEGFGADELLGLVAAAEQYSSHVLAASIVAAAGKRALPIAEVQDASEEATHGVSALVGGRRVLVGKPAWVASLAAGVVRRELGPGESSVYVAVDGVFAGVLLLADELREDAGATLERLRALGVKEMLMLTGDQQATADHIAAEIGLDTVYAECLPEDKVVHVRKLEHRPVMMVGDGVNDAPVLAAADVGVAMGARGSTAASQSADVVIMTENISQVAHAVRIGKDTLRIAVQSIWLGIVFSVVLMLVAATGVLPAVAGALSQEVVDLVAILSALRALKGGRKKAPVSRPAPAGSTVVR